MNSRVRIFDFAHEFPSVTQHWSYLTMRSPRRSTVVETQGFQFLHDSDDGLIAMETLPASFLHLLVGIVTICLPWERDSLGSKNSKKIKDTQILGQLYSLPLPAHIQPHLMRKLLLDSCKFRRGREYSTASKKERGKHNEILG